MTTLDDLARVERELRDVAAKFIAIGWDTSAKVEIQWADTIAAYIEAQGWQPIETAPRDGTFFLAISAGVNRRTGRPWQPAITAINTDGDFVPDDFHEDYFTVSANEWPVTHWMPLPPPPTATSAEKESGNG